MTTARTLGALAALLAGLAASHVPTEARAQYLGKRGYASVIGPFEHQLAASPSRTELEAAWPAAARAKGLAGSAVIHCTAMPDGTLTGCEVMIEREHAGFGQALLSLAPKFKVKPAPNGVREGRDDVVISAAWPLPDTAADWEVQPKAGDFSTTSTFAAWRSPVPGEAVMNCMVARSGATHDCMVIYQDPPGKGFGTMLLRFQSYLKLKPAVLDGKPINSAFNLPMRFAANTRPADAPPAKTGAAPKP